MRHYCTARSLSQPCKLALSSVSTILKCACISAPSAEAKKKGRMLHCSHSPASLQVHM